MRRISLFLISKRTLLQVVVAGVILLLYTTYHLSWWWLLAVGAGTGLLFGKVFCRWMCPLGFIMEAMMGMAPDQKAAQMYQYHKLGCPIAWIQGFLNRFSFLSIRLDHSSCKHCGVCDQQCYIATLEPEKYSLYLPGKQRPGVSYSCSKCLRCVSVCKSKSIKYGVKI